jgi:UDP-glucose 4-epimerase
LSIGATMTPGNDLVVGGAGFIGSELVGQLLAAGRRVTVLDDLSTGSRERLSPMEGPGLRLVIGSVLDGGLLDTLVAGAERVFNLACVGLRRSIHDPDASHEVNATGALRLLEAVRRAEVARMVHVSSSEVYGTARHAPMDESHPTHPTTPYGAAKLAGEAYARAYHLTYGLPVVIVRPFNSFGPAGHHEGDSGEAIPRFMLRAMAGLPLVVFGDGAQTRDFTYVGDTARGIALAGLVPDIVGETLNLGSGREVSISDLARQVCDIAARGPAAIKHDKRRPGDVDRLIADSRRAERLLGWRAEVPLTKGLALMHAWYVSIGKAPGDLIRNDTDRNWESGTAPRRR